jgi:cytochrome c oxidase subunit 3
LIAQEYKDALLGLLVTVFLGRYFLFLQGTEYFLSEFSLNSTVYGTVFFMLTGFHGFHVTMGTVLLLVCFFRHYYMHFSDNQHVGFEASA